jgi:methyl-accepting chemotaxis protein
MFKNLSIKCRLVLLTAILSAVAIVVGATGLANQSAANTALGTVYNDRVVVLAQLSRILSLMQQNQNTLARAALADETDASAAVGEVEGRIKQISAIWSGYKGTRLTEEEKVLAQVFIDSRLVFVAQGLKPTMAALRKHERDSAKDLVQGTLDRLFLPAQRNMEGLIKLQLDVAKQEYDQALARYSRTQMLSVALIVAGVLSGSAIAWLLIRGISRSISEALRLARSVAAGDLTQSVRVDSHDEIGQLLGAL